MKAVRGQREEHKDGVSICAPEAVKNDEIFSPSKNDEERRHLREVVEGKCGR